MPLLITKIRHKQRGTAVAKRDEAAGNTDTYAKQKCQVSFGYCLTVTEFVTHDINEDA